MVRDEDRCVDSCLRTTHSVSVSMQRMLLKTARSQTVSTCARRLRRWVGGLAWCAVGWFLSGCAMTAPMHVLHPSRLDVPAAKRIAFAPIGAREQLAAKLEQALRAQSPTIRGELQLLTAQDLLAASPVRLASTAPLTGDMTALLAARSAQAELLLMGEVVQDELNVADNNQLPPEVAQYNAARMPLIGPSNLQRPERVAVAWRVFDVASGQQVGSQTLAINRIEADRQYPTCRVSTPIRTSG